MVLFSSPSFTFVKKHFHTARSFFLALSEVSSLRTFTYILSLNATFSSSLTPATLVKRSRLVNSAHFSFFLSVSFLLYFLSIPRIKIDTAAKAGKKIQIKRKISGVKEEKRTNGENNTSSSTQFSPTLTDYRRGELGAGVLASPPQ